MELAKAGALVEREVGTRSLPNIGAAERVDGTHTRVNSGHTAPCGGVRSVAVATAAYITELLF